ncbi:MAG: alanine racemase [Clostridiales bacterium]|nr:alanine racemase [Clostridiales bacterium]
MRQTIMKVHMDALADNVRVIRENIPEKVRLMCVVKANAYGHDSIRATLKLWEAGADAFAVAIVEEARVLRNAGISCPILILGGAGDGSLREAVRIDASQAVYDLHMLDILQDEARRKGKRAMAHLKIDTGMCRIGVRGEDALDEILEHWKECPDVEMEGIFTHFCVADSDIEYTRMQNEVFKKAIAKVRAAGHDPIAHAAATSAMMNPEFQHDMVRPGIGLYGLGVPQLAGKLRLAQQLTTRPVRIQKIRAGESVGYGRTYTAERDSVIMTLPIGYGDGYSRLLSNKAQVLVKGRRANIVGRVCMDMITADVTDIPGVSMDDEVVVMGQQGDECITPEELAEMAQTIPYEIMLGFRARVTMEIVDRYRR